MPDLVLKGSGRTVYVPSEGLRDALDSGLYEAPDANQEVTVELRPGLVGKTTVADLDALEAGGATPESETSFRGRERSARIEREHSGPLSKVKTAAENVLNEATLGATGALGELIGGEEYTERRLERAEANPITAGVSKGVGIVAPTLLSGGTGAAARIAASTPLGAVTRLGTRIGKAGEGASKATKFGRAVAGGTVEGSIVGGGQAVQQLTDSTDPLTLERVGSVLSSNMLYGGGIGGAAGLVGKAAELGIAKAKGMIDKGIASRAARQAGEVPEDLAGLGAKDLRAAQKAELEAIEAARVPQRQQLADEISVFRSEAKDGKLWLATKGAKERELREIGKVSLEADKALDRVLRNPKRLANDPKAALSALQQQEHALELLAKKTDDLKLKFTADESGDRLAALERVGPALERNRSLQAKIAELADAPKSARLSSITDAMDNLSVAKAEKGLPEQMLQGSIFSAVTGATSMLGPLAPLVGAKTAKFLTEKVFGKLGKAADDVALRSSRAVSAFLDTSGKAVKTTPVLATRVLAGVSYAPSTEKPAPKRSGKSAKAPKKTPVLAEVYRKRADELRSQTAYGPEGMPVMRREAREAMAARLAPIRAVEPHTADMLETIAARRLEFLASKIPRRPDMGVMQLGPDLWQPSDMEMRTFARYAAAVEDPGGVEERLADGTVTPEDAEAFATVYPERMAAIRTQIIEQLPTLQKSLPYERRLALSIFSGVAVDPAMHPEILSVLQGSFAAEEGTEQGTQAPVPTPQFGSVRAESPTPSQARQGAET